MRGALAGAWLLGLGIVTWRQVKGGAHMPVPGALLAVTGMFAVLGVVADVYPASQTFVVVTAYGLDLAGVLNLWPAGLGGRIAGHEHGKRIRYDTGAGHEHGSRPGLGGFHRGQDRSTGRHDHGRPDHSRLVGTPAGH